jgi:hypothetical protein
VRKHAAGLAAVLKQEPGVEVEVVDGRNGELTVLVDGREVARRKWLIFKPSLKKVLAAVREATPAGSNS